MNFMLPRRLAQRVSREAARMSRTTVRHAGLDTVRVARRIYHLDDPYGRPAVPSGALQVSLPDAAALVRLATSGLLTGQVRRLRVRLAVVPDWLATRVRLPRPDRTTSHLSWRRRGSGLMLTLRWSQPRPVPAALSDAVAMVVRARSWGQTSGPVLALDRSAWLAGGVTWPQGRLTAAAPSHRPDLRETRPVGPFASAITIEAGGPKPLLSSLANPYGRVLVGAATRYRLHVGPDRLLLQTLHGRTVLRLDRTVGVEGAVASAGWDKYAVIEVTAPAGADLVGADRFTGHALRALAACGAVFAAPAPSVQQRLELLGLVTVPDSAQVDDLRGYGLSVQATRDATIAADPALRRTALGGDGALPLPAVSVVLSSKRPEHLDACLDYLARQDYPALEILVGLHGYEVPAETRRRWQEAVPFRLRVLHLPADRTFGAVLGDLSRIADGELITKVDDDDHYGKHHITDLMLAWHTSGADLVAKGARFVYFPQLAYTIDRRWAAPEAFDVSPAGGTMLLSRGTLQQAGGWSHSVKHVDEDLLTRVRATGGLTYRTHALEYAYVRRDAGHTFVADTGELLGQGECTYEKLPHLIIYP